DFFILLGTGIPKIKLIGDITTDRVAFRVEQCDAVGAGRVKPVVRLPEHLRHEELHARHGGDGELKRISGTDWTSGHRANGRVEDAVQVRAVMHRYERGH